MESLEDVILIFEVMDTGKDAPVEKSLEIFLGGIVRDDPAWYDETRTTMWRQHSPIVLGEQRVCVHVALSAERDSGQIVERNGSARVRHA